MGPALHGKYYHRYLAGASRGPDNVSMGLGIFFLGFLQRIAIGTGTVFGLLLISWLGMPRRSMVVVPRRIR